MYFFDFLVSLTHAAVAVKKVIGDSMAEVTVYLVELETSKIKQITISTTFTSYNLSLKLVKDTLFHQKLHERIIKFYRIDFDEKSDSDKFQPIFRYDRGTTEDRCFIRGNFIFVITESNIGRKSCGSKRIYLDKNITESNRKDREEIFDGTDCNILVNSYGKSCHMVNSTMSVSQDLETEYKCNFTVCVDEQPLRHRIEECLSIET